LLQPQLPRTVIHHEPDNTHCARGGDFAGRLLKNGAYSLDRAASPLLVLYSTDSGGS
jgi:hypothetical protein